MRRNISVGQVGPQQVGWCHEIFTRYLYCNVQWECSNALTLTTKRNSETVRDAAFHRWLWPDFTFRIGQPLVQRIKISSFEAVRECINLVHGGPWKFSFSFKNAATGEKCCNVILFWRKKQAWKWISNLKRVDQNNWIVYTKFNMYSNTVDVI